MTEKENKDNGRLNVDLLFFCTYHAKPFKVARGTLLANTNKNLIVFPLIDRETSLLC